jgi:hypothetical protein
MEQLNKITMDRLVSRGIEASNHKAYIRDLVNSYSSCANLTIQELNKQMNSLGWNDFELDDHTLQLIMAVTENNKRVLTSGWAVESTKKYLKFQNNDNNYLKTNNYNEINLLPVPENSIVQKHIRNFNKASGFLR